MTDRIILLRHAQSAGQAPQDDLTVQGHRDAALLLPRLAELGVDAVYSSPYLRAVATAAPFAASVNLPVQILDDLRERVLSPQALPDWQDHLRQSFTDRDYALAGGESMRQTEARGPAALRWVSAAGHALPVVVSHGGLIASLLSGFDLQFGFDDFSGLGNPDLIILAWDGSKPSAWSRPCGVG